MITVERPLLAQGVTLFRDSDDAGILWALPGAPHLAVRADGGSTFTLLEYRAADGTGGGFAELELELTVPTGAALAAAAGLPDARIAPVPFRSGDVQLLTSQNDTLVESVLGGSAAPLTPPYHAVFALDLTPEGAALLAQSITTPTAPIGVVYQYRFLALTPGLHAHVTMDYDRMYDHFSASLGFTYYVSVRLDLELSWLVEHDYITIEITEYSDAADQQRQQQNVMDLVRARVQADFFTSGLPTASDPAPLAGALGQLVGNQLNQKISSTSALFVLKARLDIESELKRFEFSYDGRTAQELTHVVSGFVGTMVPAAATPPVVRQTTAVDPFFDTLDVAVVAAVDFQGVPDLRDAAITLTYGDRVQTFVVTPEQPGPFRFTCPMDSARTDYTTHCEFHFDPASPAGPATIAAPDTTRHDRAYVVSNADAFTVVRVRLTSGTGSIDVVASMPVTLRIMPVAGGPAVAGDVVTLDATHPQLDWYRRVPGPSSAFRVLARCDWVDADGTAHQGDETEVVGANLLVRGPIVEMMSVLVQPAVDWTRVAQLAVELRHEVLGTVQDLPLVFSAAAGTDPRAVQLPLSDAAVRTYRWKQTLLHADGTSVSTDWADADTAVLLLTDAAATTSVRVVWVGDTGAALAMRVDFWVTRNGTEQQVASALLQPTQTDVTVSWAQPATGPDPQYRYEVHRLDASGDTLLHSATASELLLVVRADA